MRIGISITNHNQNENIKKTLDVLSKQTIKADVIFICSDDKQFKTKQKNVVCINNKKRKGRCQNRNSVIPYFYKNNLDAIIFIDGDTHPKDNDFIEKYEELFDNYSAL